MDPSLRKKMLAVYAVVIFLGVSLSTLIYWQGQSALRTTMLLIDQDQPALESLASFKIAVVVEEPILYEYYATTDRQRFQQRYRDNREEVERGLGFVRETFPRSIQLAAIEEKDALSRNFTSQLDETLKAENIDWDKARLLLSLISKLSVEINENLDFLVQSIQQGVFARGAEMESEHKKIFKLVVAFSVAIFLIAVLVGYYVNAYIAEAQARRKLALFPERDPNPVLRLSLDGQISYANPGTVEMLKKIGADPSAPLSLLPADLPQRLAAPVASGKAHEHWEYDIAGRTLQCEMHVLKEFNAAHVYITDITERKQAEQQLVYQAFHDPLTELENRRMFQQRLEKAISGAGENGLIGVLLLNLDRFRPIIESLGHAMGDAVLQVVAGRLSHLLEQWGDASPAGTLYRFEGDLFAILISPMDAPEAPNLLGEKIVAAMKAPLHVDSREFFLAFSIGAAVFPHDGKDVVALVKNADSALHRVKQRGGNGIQCYDREMNAQALECLELENFLRYAGERKEFELFYQPQVDIVSGCIIGMEALIRWHHPQRGLLLPSEFIPLAEESSLIIPIGEWVLRTACAQTRAWHDQGFGELTVAVNVSAHQFQSGKLPALVRQVLDESGLAPERLELEVTESVAMYDVALTIATLNEIRDAGVHLSIDDFGTGYSSMSYLKRFPISKLKIDQSFVRDMAADTEDAAIAAAVVSLGHSLRFKVIAEGVETGEQRELLASYQCDEAQGYLFNRPVPAEEFARLLHERRCLALV
ncbi:MAG: bifunctional diguanylate cyclase/phosphodiesterase [Sulfuricella sp.]|jgi:predicted signal transduction protein with EAL and GGDEF domain